MSIYVLVADAGVARFLKAKGVRIPRGLEEVNIFVRPDARMPGRELFTDRVGSMSFRASTGRGSRSRASHGAKGEFDPHATETERFARRVVRRLDELRRSGEMDRLHIVAEPRFLGMLRARLSKPTRALVTTELARDMIHAVPGDIVKAVSAAAH